MQVKPGTPVLMCSVPGYDASGLVRDLAAEQNKHITSISIGKNLQHVHSQLLFKVTSKVMHYFYMYNEIHVSHLFTNPVCGPSSGSAEGFNKADRDINTAVKSGR